MIIAADFELFQFEVTIAGIAREIMVTIKVSNKGPLAYPKIIT
jgi:hypothetical protein